MYVGHRFRLNEVEGNLPRRRLVAMVLGRVQAHKALVLMDLVNTC
jgi:hypothetical protein